MACPEDDQPDARARGRHPDGPDHLSAGVGPVPGTRSTPGGDPMPKAEQETGRGQNPTLPPVTPVDIRRGRTQPSRRPAWLVLVAGLVLLVTGVAVGHGLLIATGLVVAGVGAHLFDGPFPRRDPPRR